MSAEKTILEVRGINKNFGGIHAVEDVSFHIAPGELLGLIGPNGSGKSTTVNLISGVYTLDGGDILLEGSSIRRLSIARRAKLGVMRTFQTPKPFKGMTVFENINAIALQKYSFPEARKHTDEMLEMMGLGALRDTYADKLPIEKRKWLDFARILVTRPRLIMMDEAMAGLNPSEMAASLALIRRINQTGVAILFIEHVMRAVTDLCQRVIVLNEGRYLCEGSTAEVMHNAEVIKCYLGKEYFNAIDAGKEDANADTAAKS